MTDSKKHFDKIASEYDLWKQRNFYYHECLKKLLKTLVPAGSSIADIGCATGDILASLEPSRGLGIDISPAMIKIAESKYGDDNIQFKALDIGAINDGIDYDYVILIDVIEHIENLTVSLTHLSELVDTKAKIIISAANPLWEPALLLAEKLKLKMPEGPHIRLRVVQNEEIFKRSGFGIVERGYRLLVPKKIPGADWINSRFYKNKILARLGFVVYWVLQKNLSTLGYLTPSDTF
jgi:2-polyprenyl-3-methyl-5-hydroxy-6-metoxy-1,4-benzoquinol methylase